MNNCLYFTLQGKPVAKKRARKGAYGNWYNPSKKETIIAKRNIGEQLPETFKMIEKNVPIILNIAWFFEPSKSQATKKFIELIKNDDYPYLKKIDRDNLDKFIMDVFSKLICYDDSQIYKGTIEKYYSLNPRTEIEVKW